MHVAVAVRVLVEANRRDPFARRLFEPARAISPSLNAVEEQLRVPIEPFSCRLQAHSKRDGHGRLDIKHKLPPR